MCWWSWNLGASSSWNPQGLSRPVIGLLYLYLYLCLVMCQSRYHHARKLGQTLFILFQYHVSCIFYCFVLWPTNPQLFHKLSHCYMFRHYRVILRELVINFVLWPTIAQLFHKLSHCYMFRHYRVILRQLVINTLPSYTSISNAAIVNCNTNSCIWSTYLCNLASYWLQAVWGWHDSVEIYRSVIVCEIIVDLLVRVQNWLQAVWGWHDSIETCRSVIICEIFVQLLVIVKAIPLQAWTGPEGSRRLRLPDFKTIGTWRW